MGYPSLKDKVAIVTGANHGIGTAIATELAKEGVKVLINYYRPAAEAYGELSQKEIAEANEPGRAYYCKMQTQTADHVVAAIKEFCGSCVAIEADLTKSETIPLLFDKAEEEFGPVHIVVNNAAYGKLDSFIPEVELKKQPLFLNEYPKQTITAKSHDAHFAVNSRAVVLITAEFAKRVISRKAGWGRIINISSDGARGFSECVSYYASKWAGESFTRAAAVELGQYGITVNSVSPGPVNTGYIPSDVEKEGIKTIPMRRLGKPQDIANAVVFLASAKAEWITGQVLQVGGGNRM
jgi:3-oxoacyl-[acyl-carrier protein] reductase